MPSEHAKLSASGSERWMQCPGSIILEGLFDDEGSAYADEGTQAHAIAEKRIRARLTPTPENIQSIKEAEETCEPEMWGFTGKYEDYCFDIIDTMMMAGHTVRAYPEQKICFDRWVPEGFGTVDFCAVGGDDLHIVDFKYGKGVKVNAVGNSQMRAYALGFLQEYDFIYDNLKTVTMHIVQPRINNISVESISVKELLRWAKEELKPKAKQAFRGTRQYATGRHCRFCKAKAVCRFRTTKLLEDLTAILDNQLPF